MQTLPISSLQSTDDAHFDAELAAWPLVLVELSGTWCPPCRAMQPILLALARERPGLRVLTIDVDSNQAVARRLGVRSVPTFIVFRDGQPVGQLVGACSRRKLEALLPCAAQSMVKTTMT
jgi:thioredoxin 1